MRIDRLKLRMELAKRDMKQCELAKLSGVSRTTVGYIVGGKSCSDIVGMKIAEALEIPLEELLEN